MADDEAHDLIIQLIAAAARRDPSARIVVVRLLAAISEIAHELTEADRAEISSIMREAATELEQLYSNGHRFDFSCPSRSAADS